MSKELTEEEFSTLIKLLDKAITSKNISVKSALKELLVIAALSEGTGEEVTGPLEKLIKKIDRLEKSLNMYKYSRDLEIEKYNEKWDLPGDNTPPQPQMDRYQKELIKKLLVDGTTK